jgi:hypothetical protein
VQNRRGFTGKPSPHLLPPSGRTGATGGGGGGPGGTARRRSGELGARVAGAGGRGDRGDSGVLLTLERENSRAAGGGRQWRPAAAPRGGDGPMRLR